MPLPEGALSALEEADLEEVSKEVIDGKRAVKERQEEGREGMW